MQPIRTLLAAATLAALLAGGAADAQQMNYQGLLTDSSGNPRPDGEYTLQFRLYNAASGGARVWGPFTTTADVAGGRFNVILGPDDDGGDTLADEFANDRYLQINVNGTALTPRQKILAAPTALHAKNADLATNATNATNATSADHATTADTAANFTSTVLFTDESAGRVGIGASSPITPLHVIGHSTLAGFVRVYGGNSGQGVHSSSDMVIEDFGSAYLQLNSRDGSGAGIYFGRNGSSDDGAIQYTSGESMRFRTAGSTRMTIASSAPAVGIGTTNPQTPLHVKSLGSGVFSGIMLEEDDSSQSWRITYNTNDDDLEFRHSDGNVYFYIRDTDGTAAITSDRRAKKDIEPLDSALDQIGRIPVMRYRYLNASPEVPKTYGYFAQDVEPEFPDLVEQKEGTKTLAITGMIPINTRAIQELKAEKDAELEALREANATLLERLEALERRIDERVD